MIESNPIVRKLVALALEEDRCFEDITSELTVDAEKQGSAVLLAREPLTICGLPLLSLIHSLYGGPPIITELLVSDGERCKEMQHIACFTGSVRALLATERTILNFIQRLSGIATYTAKVKEQAGDLVVLDTRKTTPGMRTLEKYAVKVGGGENHRYHLGDMILVKNNHVDANEGDMRRTLEKVTANKPASLPFEVEVRSLNELKVALQFSPDSIMLDNMDDALIREAVGIISQSESSPFIEASGSITAQRFKALSTAGVTGVSMGALTCKAGTADLSMRISQADVTSF